jgi:hypothetical protein
MNTAENTPRLLTFSDRSGGKFTCVDRPRDIENAAFDHDATIVWDDGNTILLYETQEDCERDADNSLAAWRANR